MNKSLTNPGLRSTALFGLAATAALMAGLSAQAADVFWTNNVSAGYSNAAYWNPNVVPSGVDNAINDAGSNSVVQINSGDPNWTVNDFRAGNGDATSGAYSQNGPDVRINGWFRMGGGNGSVGYYTQNSGTLTVPLRLNLGENGTGVFTMNGGVITKTGGDPLIVSYGNWGAGSARGFLTQNGGTINSTSEMWVGQEGDGTELGTYDFHGGTNNISNWFVVGRFNGGRGVMNMDGGLLNKTGGGSIQISAANGSIGELNMSGGTISNMAGTFDIGDGGMAVVNHSGGRIYSAGQYWVGQGGTGKGTNNISGTASVVVNDWIAFGRGGSTGVVNLASGSLTKTGGGNITMATGSGTAVVVVTQTGGTITNTTSQTWLGEGGLATWHLSGGSAVLGVVHLGHAGAATVGTLNLNVGGTLTASEITKVAGTGTLNWNGGTLKPSGSSVAFFHDINSAIVRANGAVIDSQGYNVTIAQPLLNGGGGLTKNGAGTVILNGANAYVGGTVVNAGKLAVRTSSTGAGAYSVADAAGLGVTAHALNGQMNMAALTLGASVLDVDFGTFGSPTAAPANVVGALTVNGAVTLNIPNGWLGLGEIPLVKYGSLEGSGTVTLGTLPLGVQGYLTNNTAANPNTFSLVTTFVGLPRWDGIENGVLKSEWDIDTTTNWIELTTGNPALYSEGNPVLFNDSAAGTNVVDLVATVNPAAVTFNNSTNKSYTLKGSGKISGAAALTKSGNGSLTIETVNDYTGPTVISGGSVTVSSMANGGAPSAIGASSANPTNLVLSGLTFTYAGPDAVSDRGFTVQSTSTIQTISNLTVGRQVAAAGAGLVKSGAGNLTYAGTGTNVIGLGVNFNVTAGSVLFDGSAGSQVNTNAGEVWVGGTPASGAAMIISNASFNASSWVAVGRGNGTNGNQSSLSLYDANVYSVNLSLGFGNGIASNLASQTLVLNGNSTYSNSGPNLNISESGGSSSTILINGTSVFGSVGRAALGQAANATGAVVVADSGKLIVNNFMSLGLGGGRGTMVVRDNGSVSLGLNGLNVSDTGTSYGSLTLQDSGLINAGAVYVGKPVGGTGLVTVSGGTINSGGGEFQVGVSGSGTWNQSGGDVFAPTAWVSIGRNAGSVGVLNLTGGTFNQGDATKALVVAEIGSGTVNLDGGVLSATQVRSGSGNSTFNFNGGTLKAGTGANLEFMAGLTNAFVKSGGAIIDSDNNTIAIGQALRDGTGNGGLTKQGSGTLYLNGVNAYTGTTTVSNGTLGGTGTIAGPVDITATGAFAPGVSIGTLTINNSLTLAGTTVVEVDRTSGQTSDLVQGITSLTEGGALQVVITGDELVAGDTFQVFQAASVSGAFTSVTPAPAAGLAWDTNALTTTGTLTVHANPVANSDTAGAVHGQMIVISVAKLLGNDIGEAGETLSIESVSGAVLNGANVEYTAPVSGITDSFTYTVVDARGGSAVGTVTVTLSPAGQSFNQLSVHGNVMTYLGIPGYDYALEFTPSLSPATWAPILTNQAAPNGMITFTNSGAGFYRTVYVP